MRSVIGCVMFFLAALSVAPSAQRRPEPPVYGDPASYIPPSPSPDGLARVESARRDRLRAAAAIDPCAGRADGPCAYPRWSQDTVSVVGEFRLPERDNAGNWLLYGAAAVGLSEDGQRMYVSCFRNAADTDYLRGQFAIVTVPESGLASVVENCAGLSTSQLMAMSPDPSAYFPVMGGIVEAGGQVCVFGYITYDASGLTSANVWCGPRLSQLSGPFRLKDAALSESDPAQVKPGLSKAGVSRIPPEWQAMLGGTALSTCGYTSIIARASFGPCALVFNPARVAAGGREITMLLGCPNAIPACITYGTPQSFEYYNGSELAGGSFIVPGTRTFVAIEREAAGPTCYGYATRDQALHGTPYPSAANPSPENVPWCYSLSDPLNEKGPKGYPYRLVAKLYDLAELVAVKAGTRKPWDIIRPYDVVDLPGAGDGFTFGYEHGGSGPLRRRPDGRYEWLRVTQQWPGASVVRYAGFSGANQQPPPPQTCPPSCPAPGGTVTATPAAINQGQSTTIAWVGNTATVRVSIPGQAVTASSGAVSINPTHTQDVPVSFYNAAGDVVVVIAAVTVQSEPPPPPPPIPTVRCEVRGIQAPYADGDSRFTIRCDTNGKTPNTLRPGYAFQVPVSPS